MLLTVHGIGADPHAAEIVDRAVDREPVENATSVSGNIARIARSLMALIEAEASLAFT